jgi:hypothetical protein
MKNVSRIAVVLGVGVCVMGGVIAAQPQPEPAKQPEGARPDATRGRQGPARGGGELTSVEGAMKLINRSVRRLKQQAGDAEKKEENLRLVGEIERAVVFAKSQPVPDVRGRKGEGRGEAPRGAAPARNSVVTDQPEPKPTAEPKPGAEPKAEAKKPEPDPKVTEEFRRRLVGLLKEVVEIEQDLLEGKLEQAKTEVAKLPAMRDEAHKALGVKEEDE